MLTALINPENIATSIILAIFLSLIFYTSKPLLLNKVEFNVYTDFDRYKIVENDNNITVYFTLVNVGTVPLEIFNINYDWFDYADIDKSVPERWHQDKITFYDENDDEVTQTVLVPYEKMKIHINIKKPENLRSNSIVFQICPFFEPTELTLRTSLTGICNKWHRIIWE